MNLIKASIDRPIAVVSAVIMVVLFGWLALKTIPIQLAPDVNRPVITINTSWRGAAPAEIEDHRHALARGRPSGLELPAHR